MLSVTFDYLASKYRGGVISGPLLEIDHVPDYINSIGGIDRWGYWFFCWKKISGLVKITYSTIQLKK
jgi:hypothetical protein